MSNMSIPIDIDTGICLYEKKKEANDQRFKMDTSNI